MEFALSASRKHSRKQFANHSQLVRAVREHFANRESAKWKFSKTGSPATKYREILFTKWEFARSSRAGAREWISPGGPPLSDYYLDISKLRNINFKIKICASETLINLIVPKRSSRLLPK